ncbi:MAG: tRNA (N6-threonylcarbamoyladenosine(37)-N6)-methyltransferase TrmO [Parachlamydiaceae bacterium]|nr:tRNA (N6-threonylcarbamoyladenosine(37)-N6)-methyltransferase TrmO [Parachlamydiaceae bacterium]
MFTADPIGFFHSSNQEKYFVPHQPEQTIENEGVIILNSGCQYEQGLEDLDGFDRIWVVFWFHQNMNWKQKVLPPRGEKKRGVFATRSPHRPNFIGISNVELQGIEGLKLYIRNHDLIDGTPILDIKPYLNYVDAIQASKQGWVGELVQKIEYKIQWSEYSINQLIYLKDHFELDLQEGIETRLKINPFPSVNNRIKFNEHHYELAYKTWRVVYLIENDQVKVLSLVSGYDVETLEGKKTSRWDDVHIHQAFLNIFNSN